MRYKTQNGISVFKFAAIFFLVVIAGSVCLWIFQPEPRVCDGGGWFCTTAWEERSVEGVVLGLVGLVVTGFAKLAAKVIQYLQRSNPEPEAKSCVQR